MSDFQFSTDLKNKISERLSTFTVRRTERDDLRQAAVTIVVSPDPASHQATVLITMRPQKINRHSGQYALPGGRLDPGETQLQAALREVEEELGLIVSQENVLGRLDDFPTRSGFCIAPIVAWVDDLATMQPDPGEVASVHQLSFDELSSPDIPRLTDAAVGDHPVLSAFFPSLGHHIYAPTAAILYQFREVALNGRATRAAHFEQPAFAWK